MVSFFFIFLHPSEISKNSIKTKTPETDRYHSLCSRCLFTIQNTLPGFQAQQKRHIQRSFFKKTTYCTFDLQIFLLFYFVFCPSRRQSYFRSFFPGVPGKDNSIRPVSLFDC